MSETFTGQTVGKLVMGLRVVTVSGAPLTARAVFPRTMGRIVDVLPVFYLFGGSSREDRTVRRSVGDRLAGTTVAPVFAV